MTIVGEEPPEPEPVAPPDPPDADDEEDEDDPPKVPTDKVRALLRDRMVRMLDIERKHLQKAAGDPDKFLDSVEACYNDAAAVKYVAAVGLPLDVACEAYGTSGPHAGQLWLDIANESKRRMLDLSGAVVPDALAEAVAAEVATWDARIDDTLDTLFPPETGKDAA